jgi:type IV pilus assembly protein PilN
VILINLLPHRESARKRAKDTYNVLLVLAAILGALIAVGIYLAYQVEIESQQSRNAFLSAENKRLDNEIKDVATLQSEIAALRARQHAVESLQVNRNLPVYLLNETVRMLPDGMYLSSIKQEDQNVLFTGVAQSQERVSELLRNLSFKDNVWLTKPELIEIKADQLALSPRDQRRVYDFTVRAVLGEQQPGNEVASGQRAAVKTKSGV